MHPESRNHHLPKAFFAKNRQPQSSARFGDRRNCKKLARSIFDGDQVVARHRKFADIPAHSEPLVYFTREQSLPVTVLARQGDRFQIRLWDGRESECSLYYLERWLATRCFTRKQSRTSAPLSETGALGKRVIKEPGFALSLACSVASLVLLALVLCGQFLLLQPATSDETEVATVWRVLSLLGSVFAVLGFFQLRSRIQSYFSARRKQTCAGRRQIPGPRAIRRLADIPCMCQSMEILLVPVLFTAAGLVWYSPSSSSLPGQGFCLAALLCGSIFASRYPSLVDSWNTAIQWSLCRRQEELANNGPDPDEAEPAVRTHNLFLAHPDGRSEPLIDHLSFSVRRGSRVGFLGSKPADCAILFRLLAGQLQPDRGLVWVDGKMVSSDVSGTIGWFHEKSSLIDATLRENLVMHRATVTETQLSDIVRFTELDRCSEFASRSIDTPVRETMTLAPETRLRIQLARALIHQPDILIFISPNSAQIEELFTDLVQQYLNSAQPTLLLAATRGAPLRKLTSHALVVEQGKIAANGPTGLILENLSNGLLPSSLSNF